MSPFVPPLAANVGRSQGSYTLDVTLGQTGLYDVRIQVNGLTWEYEELPILLSEFQVQSHWGSGVIFSNMKVVKK